MRHPDLLSVDRDMVARHITLNQAFVEWNMIRRGWTYEELVDRRKAKKERMELNQKRSKSLKGKSLEVLTSELEKRALEEAQYFLGGLWDYECEEEGFGSDEDALYYNEGSGASCHFTPLVLKKSIDEDLMESNTYGIHGLSLV